MIAETQLVGYKGVVGVWLAMAIFYTVRYILLALHYSRLGTLKANVPLAEVAGRQPTRVATVSPLDC
jgi:hypothetical protein